MPLRIAFDLDGVLADMESELVRQAEAIFGEAMTRRLQEGVPGAADMSLTAAAPSGAGDAAAQVASEKAPDPIPPLLKLRMSIINKW